MSSCCGVNNGCSCRSCRGVKMSQFAQLNTVSAGTLVVTSDNKLAPISAIEQYLLLKVGNAKSAKFATSTTTATLIPVPGADNVFGCTNTTVSRTLTISTSTISAGSPTTPLFITIKDESGGAGTNNIIITTEGTQTIDGAASVSITADYGAIRLYSDGTKLFTR